MQTKGVQKFSAQELQDEIFRKMPPAEKLEMGFQLWSLAKELAGEKFTYDAGKIRPKTSSHTGRQDS